LEFQDSKKDSLERLESLSNFQKEIILHAFKFPSVQKVVYSTCSIHREENEDVVKYILENQADFVLEENVFPEWTRRGFDTDDFDQGILFNF
jgi:putative methyltransferase